MMAASHGAFTSARTPLDVRVHMLKAWIHAHVILLQVILRDEAFSNPSFGAKIQNFRARLILKTF
jgi:hypothetical protein